MQRQSISLRREAPNRRTPWASRARARRNAERIRLSHTPGVWEREWDLLHRQSTGNSITEIADRRARYRNSAHSSAGQRYCEWQRKIVANPPLIGFAPQWHIKRHSTPRHVSAL